MSFMAAVKLSAPVKSKAPLILPVVYKVFVLAVAVKLFVPILSNTTLVAKLSFSFHCEIVESYTLNGLPVPQLIDEELEELEDELKELELEDEEELDRLEELLELDEEEELTVGGESNVPLLVKVWIVCPPTCVIVPPTPSKPTEA